MRTLNRREALALLGSAGAAALLGAEGRGRTLRLQYKTDPERIARMLPPPLEPAEPLILVDCAEFPANESGASAQSMTGVARVLIRCRHGETEGWLPVDIRAAADRDRLVLRERWQLPARAGDVRLSDQEGRLEAVVRDGGLTLLRLRAKPTERESEAPAAGPLFAFNAQLRPDWTRGPLSDEPVELLILQQTEESRPARICEEPELEWPDASPRDPGIEFPIVEKAGCWRIDGAAASFEAQRAAEVSPEDFAPWAFLRYGRPISADRPWTPAGWRADATAFRISSDEAKRWRSRPEIILEPLEVVELDAMISRETHEALLPPPCRPAGRPMIKLLGLRVNGGDLSRQPFTEIWLFTFCVAAGRAAWFALSHVVGPGGDLVLGREAFGYPSKAGDPDIVVTPIDFSLAGNRFGREFVYADGSFRGFATGTSLGRMAVVGLRIPPGRRAGRLVYQAWTFQGRRNRVDPRTLGMDFPQSASKIVGVSNDPWFELSPFRLAAVSVMDGAVMQRQPGEDIGPVLDFEPFYRERCDGILPWEATPEKPPQPTFLVGGDVATRS